MANLNIAITIDSQQAEAELKKFQGMIEGMVRNFEKMKKSLGFGDETIKEAQKLSKSIQTIEGDVKQVVQTTQDISKVATQGFSGLREEVEKTGKGFIGLQYSLKSILTDALTLMNFQLRWYAARQIVFGVPRAIKAGIGFEAEIDKAQALLLRYSAMEGQITDTHRQMVTDIITYSRQLAINLPIAFGEIVKAADRLLAAGVDIDTVKGSLESFAKLQVAYPEIEPEKFTTAVVGFMNTFRKTPGLKEFENDSQRLQVILDKLTVALAKGVIAPRDINVVIQNLGQMSQAAGFSIDQMLALSVMVTNLGSKAGPAARALRGLIDSLSAPKGLENLQKIGIQLDRSKTIASQFKTIIEGLRKAVGTGEQGLTLGAMEFLKGIAPTQRRSALIALIRELETYQDLVNSISQSQGALDRTAGVMTDTLSSQWKILKNLTRELGAALVNSDLLKSGLGYLIDILKVLGFWLSGIAGVLSIVEDGFKWLWHSIAEVTNPLERLTTALLKAATGDLKGAWQELMRMPEVYYEHEEKAADALRGSLERAAKETKTIQDVLFGRSKFTGGKGEIKGGGMLGGEVPLPASDEEIKALQERLRNEHDIYKDHLQALKKLHEEGIAAMDEINAVEAERDKFANEQLKGNLDDRSWLLQTFYREELTGAKTFYEQKGQILKDSLQGELTLIQNETGRQLDVLSQKYADAEETWWDLANRYDEVGNQMQGITDKKALKYLENEFRDLEIQMQATNVEMTKLSTKMQVVTEQGFDKQALAIQRYNSEILKANYEMRIAEAVQPFKQQEWFLGQQETYNKYLQEAAELTGNWNAVERMKLELIRNETTLYKAQIARVNAEADFIDAYLKEANVSKEVFNYLSNVSHALRDQVPVLQRVEEAWKKLQAIREAYEKRKQVAPFMTGVEDAIREWGSINDQMYEIGKNTVTSMQQMWSDSFFDVMKGEFKNFGQYLINFEESILRSLSDMISKWITEMIFDQLLKQTFSFLGNLFGPTVYPTEAAMYENRQMGGNVYAGRSYIVGERRPELFTPRTSGKITPYVPQPTIENKIIIENKSSWPVKAKIGPTKFDLKGPVTTVILEDFITNGPIKRALPQAIK